MKKRLMYLLVAVMLVFTACSSKGGKTENESEKEEQKEEATSPEWAKNAVFYELFVRSFYDADGDGIGDFKGVTQKVDYLKELGIDAVWLMPINTSDTYHGYDVVDYYGVESDYGTMADFEEMLKTLHDNDIKVIMDFVVNHTASTNEMFIDAFTNTDSKYKDFYVKSEVQPTDTNGWYPRELDGKIVFYYAQYSSNMPELDYKNNDVREEIKKATKFWLDKGIDGFRLDASRNIDEDKAVTHSWWKEFTQYVSSINNQAFVVGENWYNSSKEIAPYYGDMISSFDFPICTTIESMATGSLQDIIGQMNDSLEMYENEQKADDSVSPLMIDSVMIDNHDMDRIASRVGSEAKAKLAATIQFTIPGTPYIYYGDELGQLGTSPDGNRREPFDWYTACDGTGMTEMNQQYYDNILYDKANDGISYEEEKDNNDSMLSWYKNIISMRKSEPLFTNGDYKLFGINESGLYAYTITSADSEKALLVIHNLRDDDISFALKADVKDILSGTDIKAADVYTLKGNNSLVLEYKGEVPLNKDEFSFEAPKPYTVELKVTLPANTPMDENIYVTGSFNEWNECDEVFIMDRISETECSISLEADAFSKMQFKFTRGTWDKREQGADGKDLIGPDKTENRSYTFEEDAHTLECTIEKWSDIS